MDATELHDGIVRLCQAYGTTTEDTYDLIHKVVDSIETADDSDGAVYPPTCILTGAPGEDPDDCTTHEHE